MHKALCSSTELLSYSSPLDMPIPDHHPNGVAKHSIGMKTNLATNRFLPLNATNSIYMDQTNFMVDDLLISTHNIIFHRKINQLAGQKTFIPAKFRLGKIKIFR
jgi:hypothetical protein